ncbi:hypothetical protein V6C53_19660 [Desulfocurvibacter africanus]|uniref:hypothetical protein n=1 Tax=Desulfocurvibacter africanus TaxID=873 RepID=UPI002FD8AE0F
MAVDANRVTQRALSKLSDKFDTGHEHLTELVRAICEAVCEEVPFIEDIGGTPTNPPATAHK